MELCRYIEKCAGPLSSSGSAYSRKYIFPPSFPGFDGHFPDNPILPGVIQTLLGELCSMEVLRETFPGESLSLESITRCKFMRQIKPDEEISLEFTFKRKDLKQISLCELRVGGEPAATYQLIFSPEQK